VNCTSLTRVTIADGVANIEAFAFQNCTHLASVTIPGSVTNIGADAFIACPGLTGVFFGGNMPALGTDVFSYDLKLKIYYLSDTAGWADFPAESDVSPVLVLWNPLIQGSGARFGIQTNRFGFNITNGSTTNITIVVEACTNLANPVWVPLLTNTLTNSFYFSDSQWTNYPSRFYGLGFP